MKCKKCKDELWYDIGHMYFFCPNPSCELWTKPQELQKEVERSETDSEKFPGK